jgi:hypothetical protein
MQSGISDHVWSLEELWDLLPQRTSPVSRIAKAMILKALD